MNCCVGMCSAQQDIKYNTPVKRYLNLTKWILPTHASRRAGPMSKEFKAAGIEPRYCARQFQGPPTEPYPNYVKLNLWAEKLAEAAPFTKPIEAGTQFDRKIQDAGINPPDVHTEITHPIKWHIRKPVPEKWGTSIQRSQSNFREPTDTTHLEKHRKHLVNIIRLFPWTIYVDV